MTCRRIFIFISPLSVSVYDKATVSFAGATPWEHMVKERQVMMDVLLTTANEEFCADLLMNRLDGQPDTVKSLNTSGTHLEELVALFKLTTDQS